jgi:transcriptional regulator with XRE-family HTH domain
MQADSLFPNSVQYNAPMTAGRPAKFTRSAFGEKLFAARQQMGLSQTQLAEKLGITQSTYAGWERRTTALRPDYIAKIASAMNVSVDYLLGRENDGKRKGGPVGQARRIFEEVSRLPRHKQKRILGIVEDLLAAQRVQQR